jgi:hypothetical protein
MIGCFNIALFSYFDIHRIFDLISCRMWDFILWWFDLDFLLFDFNFDFILCLSFIFIFLIHFFFKLLFSFLINFIVVNKAFNVYKIFITFLVQSIIYFLTYILLVGVFYMFQILEIYIYLNIICFSDFTSFSDVLCIQNKTSNITSKQLTYIYIMFYYVLMILTKFYLLLFRHFYTQTYTHQTYVDQIVTNKSIDITSVSILPLYVLDNNHLYNTSCNIYSYLILLNINTLLLQNMTCIFYMFLIFNYVHKSVIYLQVLKISKYLYQLNSNYILLFHKNIFSNILFIYLFIYIIFLINFLGVFIKDFNYIVININALLIIVLFSIKLLNFNTIINYWFKKQLNLVLYY